MAPLRDRRLKYEQGFLDVEGRICELFRNYWVWYKKSTRVGVSRWMASLDGMKSLDPEWHSLLIVVTYLLFQLGELDEKLFESLHKVTTKTTEGDDDDVRESITASTEKATYMRKLCNNGLHFMLGFLSNPINQHKARVILSASKLARQWYSEQSTSLRSTFEAAAWLEKQMVDGVWDHIFDIWNVLNDTSTQEYIGL